MAIPPPADDSAPIKNEARDRLEMERNWQLRQENVLPLEAAWNEGRFYGLVLKGSKRFTSVQRVGIFLIGFLALGTALTIVPLLFHGVGPSLQLVYQKLPDVSLLSMPVILLELAFGFRLCWVALKRPSRDPKSTSQIT